MTVNISRELKKKFKLLIEQIIEQEFDIEDEIIQRKIPSGKAGNVCHIRRYIIPKGKGYEFNDKEESNFLTLREWYDSIVDSEKRVEGKDKLSPLLDLTLAHGTGAYDWEKVRVPLIEVRGYSALFGEKVEGNNTDNMINELYNFVIQESNWFFNLLANNRQEEK